MEENVESNVEKYDESEESTNENKKYLFDKEYVTEERIVPDNQRRTSDILTLYEITEAIGIRAKQISKNTVIYTNVDGITDPIEMAEKEFFDRKSPLKLKRQIGVRVDHENKKIIKFIEIFNIREMGIKDL